MFRVLVLPWADIAEVAARTVRDEPILLLRLGTWPAAARAARGARSSHRSDRHARAMRPGWWDRTVLRAVRRSVRGPDRALRGYDLAVRLDDFAGRPDGQLTTLAAFAPDHVVFSNRI
jgi:hypothetical protein